MDGGHTPGFEPVPLPMYHGPDHPCPYLPGRTARDIFTMDLEFDPRLYQILMERGYRRSGMIVYRPDCEGCRECVSIRVPVAEFRPSRSQRRACRRNQDIRVETGEPHPTDRKWRIYRDYLRFQHDDTMSGDRESFERFLYGSPTTTEEMVYYAGRTIVAVGIVDTCPESMSSVYFYFDPAEARRSLGVFGAIQEIETCRQRGYAYWYLGYLVRGCRAMRYKADYRPHELLDEDGTWRPAAAAAQ